MKLRRITLLLLANVVSLGLLAEGYQLNLQSTKQLGMGYLGGALKLGGESMLFNPAGMVFMETKSEASFGVNAVISKANYVSGTNNFFSHNKIGTPIFGYYSYKVNDDVAVGVTINNPAGNGMNWGGNWPGNTFVQSIDLAVYTLQPTISVKLGDKFSVGAGLMVNFGSFTLSKALIPAGGLAGLATAVPTLAPTINYYKGVPAVSLELEGKSKVGYGFNVGILYEPFENFTIGVSYRSKIDMSVDDGTAKLQYPGPAMSYVITTAAGIPSLAATFMPIVMLDNEKFAASLPIPSDLKVGVAYKPNKDFTVSAEIDYVGWKAYDKLEFDFATEALGKSVITKNFKNTFIYRIGAEYKTTEKVTGRVGFIYDQTPVDTEHYGPETPGATKFSFTTGFTFSPTKKFDIDVAFQYLTSEKIDGTTTSGSNTLSGTYQTTAFIPSLGVKFKF